MMAENPKRFEAEVAALEKKMPPQGGILLYGSSFFTMWGHDGPQNAVNAAGKKARITNHGFGGTLVDDLLYFYHRLVRPCRPDVVILRTGVNDLAKGLAPSEAFLLVERLCGWILSDFPEARIRLMAIFDMPRKEWLNEPFFRLIADYNEKCAAFTRQSLQMGLLDVNAFFYDKASDIGTHKGFKDVFCEDGLHLTQAGYRAFEPFFIGQLEKEGLL